MKKISLLLVACATLLFASCESKESNNSEEQAAVETETTEVVAETPSYVGSYEGTLPCADCSGILTKLTVREDTTYDLSTEYLGKKDAKFEESGVYELNGDLIVLITPSSGEKTYYKILENSVALVDSTGVLNTGELADKYILTKIAQ
ncbi:hypothetical protein IX332_001732 [Porphyromonas levii]|uniref:copper resistance protein NlpE n=1 Tax=Porphyromonas levii TaxID=28114 RepID=UPI001B8B8926|nr:copper resistance protein NlpE [Porphyromonas levii]MBR8730388.1 hypothetical protein [Porphyromonas levii]MBR8732294.1 hypothetical protein [Porphyromonas levii]MBR8759992.1 hypothetical protein [Porphyromonas levii]MBR8764539.1 hypothetical protein [Porphyromonas levii]MBR8766531.1 hypothetical protein [Porphyromonas levii]